MKCIKIIMIVMVGLAASINISTAGSTHPSDASSQFEPEEIVDFAKDIETILAQRKAAVAIVGRIGRPQSDLPPGIQFTHTAFWVYSQIQTQEGATVPGYAVFNLYQRSHQADRSDLVQDFPVDFMLGVCDLEVGIIVPSRALQKRLLDVISSAAYQRLHNPDYSAIANPYNNRYQNCTEFVTNVIFASIYNTDDMGEIKSGLKAWFAPQPIEVSQLKLTLGSLLMPDIKLADHEGKPATATFGTIAGFLKAENLAQEVMMVSNDTLASTLGSEKAFDN